MEVTTEVYTVLSSQQTWLKKLNVVADDAVKDDSLLGSLFAASLLPSMYNSEDQVLDVAICKNTLVKSFVECFKWLYQDSDRSHDSLTLLACMGILLVTPEDHTALDLSEDYLKEASREDVLDVFAYICALLSSSLKKTNKSSSLWLYFRKLLVRILRWHDTTYTMESLIAFALKLVLLSVRAHPRNYYACNTLRFLVSLVRVHGSLDLMRRCEAVLLTHLQRDGLTDHSLWLAWVQLVVKLDTEEHYQKEFEGCGGIDEKQDFSFSKEEVLTIYFNLLSWLKSSNYSHYSGWLAVTLMALKVGEVGELADYFSSCFRAFEVRYSSTIDVKHELLLSSNGPVNLDTDLLLKEEFTKSLALKKIYGNQLRQAK